MTRRVFNYGGGMHSPAALTQFVRDALAGEVANGMEVVAASGMNVTVKAGTSVVGHDPSYDINISGTETVDVGAASPSNPMNALIVAYVDRDVAGSTAVTDNTNDVFKLKAVSGAAAATPSDPTMSAIQAAIGAANPFIILARVRKRAGATSVVEGDITDLRKMITLRPGRISDSGILGKDVVNSDQIVDGSVQPEKLADSLTTYKSAEMDTGKKWIDGRPIFRKVVRGTVNMTGGYNTSSLPHGIAGLTDAWELISWSGNMRLSGVLSSNPIKQALPYIEGTHQAGITSIDKTSIAISGSYTWGISEVSITMEYVK